MELLRDHTPSTRPTLWADCRRRGGADAKHSAHSSHYQRHQAKTHEQKRSYGWTTSRTPENLPTGVRCPGSPR
jgi:hypothetical protein